MSLALARAASRMIPYAPRAYRAMKAAKRTYSAANTAYNMYTAGRKIAKIGSRWRKGRKAQAPRKRFSISRNRRPSVKTILNGDLKIDKSHIRLGKGKPIRGVPSYLSLQYSGVVDSPRQGVQSVNLMPAMFTLRQLLTQPTIPSGTTVNNPDTWPLTPFNLILNQRQTGNSAILPLALSTRPGNQSVFINHMTYELDLTNFTEISNEFYVMWVTPTKDTTLNPMTFWSDCKFTEIADWGNTLSSALQFINPPDKNAGGAGSGAPSIYTWGQMPQQHTEWRRNFKILKSEHFVMQPGAAKRTKYIVHVNKKINERVLNNKDIASFLANFTVWPLVISKPKMIGNDTGSLKVYPGPIQYAYAVSTKICCKPVNERLQVLNFNNEGFADPLYADEKANQENVDDEDKIVIPDKMFG